MTFCFEKDQVTALSPAGIAIGRIVFPQVRAGLVNISEVTVFPSFRGQGVENAMLEALLVHLDNRNLKAALTCSHAQNYVQQNPRWKRILPGEMHFTSH